MFCQLLLLGDSVLFCRCQAIVFCPTYELALQTAEVVEKMGKYMEGLKVIRAVKGGQRCKWEGERMVGCCCVFGRL